MNVEQFCEVIDNLCPCTRRIGGEFGDPLLRHTYQDQPEFW